MATVQEYKLRNIYDRPSKIVQKKCFPHFSVIHTRALGVKFPVK